MAKYPAFQFYPSDWLSDNIAGCSLAAQGLWLRMMLVMHSAERRGYLAMNGGPMSDDFVSRRCGCEAEAYRSLLAELFDAGIPSRTSDGIIYNRRMVRDEIKRANYSVGNKGKGIVRAQTEAQIPNKPSPKCSEVEDVVKNKAFELPDWMPADLWKDFVEHRKKLRKPMTERAMRGVLRDIDELRDRGFQVEPLVDMAIKKGWLTVYEPNKPRGGALVTQEEMLAIINP